MSNDFESPGDWLRVKKRDSFPDSSSNRLGPALSADVTLMPPSAAQLRLMGASQPKSSLASCRWLTQSSECGGAPGSQLPSVRRLWKKSQWPSVVRFGAASSEIGRASCRERV